MLSASPSNSDIARFGSKAEKFTLSNSCPLSTRVQREQNGHGQMFNH